MVILVRWKTLLSSSKLRRLCPSCRFNNVLKRPSKTEVFWAGPRHDKSMITQPLHLSDVKLKRNYKTFFNILHYHHHHQHRPVNQLKEAWWSYFLTSKYWCSAFEVQLESLIFFILSYQDIVIKHASFRANVRSLQMLKNLNWKDDLKFCQLHQFHPSIAFHHQGTWKACHGDQNEWRMIVQFNCSFLAELLYPGRQLEDGYKLEYLRCQVFKPSRDLIWFKEKKSFVE